MAELKITTADPGEYAQVEEPLIPGFSVIENDFSFLANHGHLSFKQKPRLRIKLSSLEKMLQLSLRFATSSMRYCRESTQSCLRKRSACITRTFTGLRKRIKLRFGEIHENRMR